MNDATPASRLQAALGRHRQLAIAVSGGVDSMLLAYVANKHPGIEVSVFHAVSPAVPAIATQRVQSYAAMHNWVLHIVDAGEMQDVRYTSNPVNRCFYCKTNLYTRIRSVTALPIASGTNTDDLSDYRPGLEAASDHGVYQPYVEAGIQKRDIYAMAHAYGLSEISDLPSQPCLSSRIETGIGVDRSALEFIERAEIGLSSLLPAQESLRCRITAKGVVIECSDLPGAAERLRAEQWLNALCIETGRPFAGMRQYRRGAAFLRVL